MTHPDRSLFAPFTLGPHRLRNRIVLAPLTRSRATGNIPTALMAEYYGQRASAGLIVTEGTSPSPNGLGYPRIPGVFTAEQLAGWQAVTAAVHAGGAKIFMQLMHTGRVGHPHNLPAGARLLAPSTIAAAGEMYTDEAGLQPHPVPEAMSRAGSPAPRSTRRISTLSTRPARRVTSTTRRWGRAETMLADC